MLRKTAPVMAILELFLPDPTHQRYGLEIADELGLKSGVLYPALHRLHAEGWLDRDTEDVDPRKIGRPVRRLYSITPLGQRCAIEWREKTPGTRSERIAIRPAPTAI